MSHPRYAFSRWAANRFGGHAAAAAAWDRAASSNDAEAHAHVAAWLALDGWPPGTPLAKNGAAAASRTANLKPVARELATIASIGAGLAPKQIQIARCGDVTILDDPLRARRARWRIRDIWRFNGGEVDLDEKQIRALLAVMRFGRSAPVQAEDFVLRGENGAPCSIHQVRRAIRSGRALCAHESA